MRLNPLEFSLELRLDKTIDISSRIRYNVWDLLADVGGFHDGMYLVASIIFGSYSAFAFKRELISNMNFDADNLESVRRESMAYQNS